MKTLREKLLEILHNPAVGFEDEMLADQILALLEEENNHARTPQEITQPNWEKEFDRNWMDIRAGNPNFDWRILNKDIKDFIRKILQEQKEEILKSKPKEKKGIELTKELRSYNVANDYPEDFLPPEEGVEGYNQALADWEEEIKTL